MLESRPGREREVGSVVVTLCKRAKRVREEMVFWYVLLVAARGTRHLLGAQANVLGEKMEPVANGEKRRQ